MALALVWTFPLATHLQTHVPGAYAGDNVSFVWNFWWMRQALATGRSFFYTDLLFAPFGIDLTLYTHTALQAFVGATALARVSPLEAQNIVIVASLALNGVAAYVLAFDRTGDRAAAVCGGLVFAGSSFIAVHLMGHFNLISPWGIPLFLLCVLRALDQEEQAPESTRAWLWAAAAGVCLIAVAYTDYYYFVYCLVLASGLGIARLRAVSFSIRPVALSRRLSTALGILLTVDVAVACAIVASGGFVFRIGSVAVHAERPTNVLTFGWLLAAVWALMRLRPRISWAAIPSGRFIRVVRPLVVIGVVALVGMLPLAQHAIDLWRHGGYVTPRHSWRSGAGGVDAATLVLGNPMHPAWRSIAARLYARLAIQPIEGVAWTGVVPCVFLWIAARRFRRDPEIARWLGVGAAFFVWALGPWLVVGGLNTGLMLPENLFQFVPIVSNARIPGRAMAVVFLSLGMITALVFARIRTPASSSRSGWDVLASNKAIWLTAAAIVIESLPAPYPLTALERPPIYDRLRIETTAGSLCELPVGLHDGFGEYGRFDNMAMFHQTVHGRPLVGGATSRIPDAIQNGYRTMPVVRSLFSLSDGGTAVAEDATLSRADASAALERAGIGLILLDNSRAPAALGRYVESLPIRIIASDGQRVLYRVRD